MAEDLTVDQTSPSIDKIIEEMSGAVYGYVHDHSKVQDTMNKKGKKNRRKKDELLNTGQERHLAAQEQNQKSTTDKQNTHLETKNLQIHSLIDPKAELEPHIPDRDYAEFTIRTIKKTVKQEDSLVRQIYYTGLSKDTANPQNLMILCPTSEGKTYAVTEDLQYFPDGSVWYIGSMSPKVLIRQKGILVDSNTLKPIDSKIKFLNKRIRWAKKNHNSDLEEELREELRRVYENCKRLINLQGTKTGIWIFILDSIN